jgi:hypothetical protein
MIDYADYVLKLKILERQYHDSMLKNDIKSAKTISKEILKLTTEMNEFTEGLSV